MRSFAVTALGSNVIIPIIFCQRARLCRGQVNEAHSRKETQRLVVVLAFEGVQLLDVAGPVQTFASANEMAVEAWRRTAPLTTSSWFRAAAVPVATSSGLAAADAADRQGNRQ